MRRPAIRAPDDGRTDWFAGGADRATRVLAGIRFKAASPRQGRAYLGCNSDNRSVWRSRLRFATVRNSIRIAGSASVQSISM